MLLDDYLSEKFWQAFKLSSLMVYMGPPDILQYLPHPNAVINAHNFAGPKELAEYLTRVAGDEALFASHFAWRREWAAARDVGQLRALQPNFVRAQAGDLMQLGKDSFLCHLCEHYQREYCPPGSVA
jgi:hypothetical protein